MAEPKAPGARVSMRMRKKFPKSERKKLWRTRGAAKLRTLRRVAVIDR